MNAAVPVPVKVAIRVEKRWGDDPAAELEAGEVDHAEGAA